MPFHNIRHVDTVALNYSSNAMAPLSPNISRHYFNGASDSANSNLSSTPKFSSYRSSTSATSVSSLHERTGYGHRLTRLATSSLPNSQQRYMLSSSTNLDFNKCSPNIYMHKIQRTASQSDTSNLINKNEIGTDFLPVQHRLRINNEVTSNGHNNNSRTLGIACLIDNNNDDDDVNGRSANPTDADDVTDNKNKVEPSSYANPSFNCMEPLDTKSANKFVAQVPTTTQLATSVSATLETASASTSEYGSTGKSNVKNRLKNTGDNRCGLNGLRNIGNTCFMNSVIQCLSNTRPLLEYLLNEQYMADINTTTSSMKGALMKAFSQVVQELWESDGDRVVDTLSLKSQIQRFAPRFMGYSQQDAQEFLRYLLEGLHEDVNRVTIKPQSIHTDIPDTYSDSMKATESWKRYLRNEDSIIVDVFVGQLRSSLRCTICDHVSVTLDPFWDLSLPIPSRSGTVKLNLCLEHFTREEVLDGDEKPTCFKCQTRRKCTKSFSIQKFPKILVIHLKRFSPMERFRGKLNVLVDFPLTTLDLSAFAAPRVQGCTYNLYGIANHSGTTHSGHYTSYCKHPYSGEWHEYNDSRVTPVSARSVVSNEGYVLFYEQQPHNSHL
ncbi:PREDICTED: ubiquitin carboxyl-terminal hydrolase 2-like [Ceratosolen solmsi marchali]|uniref:Ubiquitin carboxyl-terminal hydrolase n=1 Tax=Ceratosolen solmsi marchali TaxID=326594 RepID=A0AAJ6YDN8_9HYME|nr:PREDICTED: ubiquitin carboxyl-terminal hydrolase 2-like [Ceratosolen solmsi marchali]